MYVRFIVSIILHVQKDANVVSFASAFSRESSPENQINKSKEKNKCKNTKIGEKEWKNKINQTKQQ